jgi:hypothetical protein
MNEDDKNLDAGFYGEFEELGEHAVRRRLDDFTPGKRPVAADWLDRKAAERERAPARSALVCASLVLLSA